MPKKTLPAKDLQALQKEFATFTTQNTLFFADSTYFLASMEMRPSGTSLLLYPGGEASYRKDALIPDKFRDPNDPEKIHPDLVIKVRRKAHRVFHEEILGHKISIFQTIFPHPAVDLFDTRGGGAKLMNRQLYPQYKSGVLNGKWSLPFIGEDLKYGDLPKQDQPKFNRALYQSTNVTIVTLIF
jgi:hypothetical protein